MRVVMVGPADPVVLADLLDTSADSVPKGMGGVPVTELTRELVRRGHQVTLVTASPAVSQAWEGSGAGLTVHVSPYRRSVRQRLKGRFRLEIDAMASAIPPADEYDVIHAHWTYEFAAAALSRDRNSLITAHDSPWTVLRYYRQTYRAFRLAMAWNVARRARFLTAVSPWLAQRWKRQMRYAGTIAVIPNIAPSPPAGMARAAVPSSFISVGDSGRNKNTGTLLKAFAILRTRIPDATLSLVGPGLEESGTMSLSWDGPVDGVTFRGTLDRGALWQALMSSAVLVHPSFHECQPVTFLEAMRAGLPVVAGRHSGGAAWTLDEGAAGTLTDITDPSALADAMASALLEPDPVKVAAAAALVESRYSPGAVASAYEQEYQAIRRHRTSQG